MQAYSSDLRERVVSAYENGVETILEVAERFEVSDSFIKKLLRRKRTTGEIALIGHRGEPPQRLSGSIKNGCSKQSCPNRIARLAN